MQSKEDVMRSFFETKPEGDDGENAQHRYERDKLLLLAVLEVRDLLSQKK